MNDAANMTEHTSDGCHTSICCIHSSWMIPMARHSQWLPTCCLQFWLKWHRFRLPLMHSVSGFLNTIRTALCGLNLSLTQQRELVRICIKCCCAQLKLP